MINLIKALAELGDGRAGCGARGELRSGQYGTVPSMESSVSVYQELCGAARQSAVAQFTPLPDNVAGPSGAGFGLSTRLDVVLETA